MVLRRIRVHERQETRAEFAESMARKADELGEGVSPSERHVARLEDGEIRWPHPASRRVLSALCGRPVTELGFGGRMFTVRFLLIPVLTGSRVHTRSWPVMSSAGRRSRSLTT